MSRSVVVTAPARLHLGMFSFGQSGVRQFGGVGIMVDAPATRMEITTGEKFSAIGPDANRVEKIVERVVSSGMFETTPRCTIRVLEGPPPHVGLGSGTQLALAVARGLLAVAGRAAPPAIDIARRLGRARRSAVGSYGFDLGGMIVEAGHRGDDSISPLVARVALPTDWRFVLARPRYSVGLSGGDEERAFGSLAAVPVSVTDQLCREALLELVPAARLGDFEHFCASMARYGQIAGSCFAAAQHGAFASVEVERLVARIGALGFHGVAQSSWGPTVAAAASSQTEAETLVDALSRDASGSPWDVLITRANNSGATIVSP